MAEVPVVINGVMFDKHKGAGSKPVQVFIVGVQYNPSLHVDTGPVEPPPDIKPEPPLEIWPPEIWGGGGIGDYIDAGLPIPQPPPDKPPAQVEPPHEGWNWSVAKSQWYYLYVPGKDAAQPKK